MCQYKFNPESLATLLPENNTNGGEFTVRSLKTGKDFTFKVSRSEFNGRFYTHVKVETGYLQFQHLGTFKDGQIVKKGSPVQAPAGVAAAWILRAIEAKKWDVLRDNVELFHFGKCVRCGRELTDAVSIETGMGPHCRVASGL